MTVSDSTESVEIREVTPHDAARLLNLRLALDLETDYMMFEPGERVSTVEDELAHIVDVCARHNSTILVACVGDEIVGYLEASGGSFRRNQHMAEIVIGVRAGYGGRGIGTHLFEQLERWAKAAGVHRLELTVMTNNERALRLYERAGFEVEGTRRHSLRVNGRYVDEFAMVRLLNHDDPPEDSGRIRA